VEEWWHSVVRPTAGSEAAGYAAEAPTAVQAQTGCVSRGEFRAAKRGWKVRRVHRLFDTTGRIIFAARNPGTAKYTARQYRTCAVPKLAALTVDFSNGRLLYKNLVFTSLQDTPKCMSNQEFRIIRRGMSPLRVARIADTAGGFLDGFAGGYARGYDLCETTRRAKHAIVVYVSRRSGPPGAVKVSDKDKGIVSRR
jgi:hypothetical protein